MAVHSWRFILGAVIQWITKTGYAVVNYTPKGFVKILTGNVERARGRGVQKFWGLAEIERARGVMEAGAFGQRGKWGRL